MKPSILNRIFLISCLFILIYCGVKKQSPQVNETAPSYVILDSIRFEYEEISGIGYEEGITRRDPSDIIKVNNTYYIWYTKVPLTTNGERTRLYNSGYYGTIWYATSTDGSNWTEKGQALAPGKKGAFDSHAVFTPNILFYEGKYYLYYTGVKPTPGNEEHIFENNSETDFTAIGMAVADSPDGPFSRITNEPILTFSNDSADFDSYRVDDAALNIKDGKFWLYYKGRSIIYGEKGPMYTQMGIAMAENPAGPFEKYGTPVMDRSHEVIIWNLYGGVASMACLNRTLNYAGDGIHFSKVRGDIENLPAAPGLYRPFISGDTNSIEKVNWGISMGFKEGHVFLKKFKMSF